MGRQDFQVKIRGYRVEISEIEQALLKLESVKEAVVMAREDEGSARRLVAYLVPEPGQPMNVSSLRRSLAEKMPDHLIPAAFVELESMPVTLTGKVDRQALPQPSSDRPILETAYVPARTPVEQNLAEIWKEVLGLERVGMDDNFLELGGDSLLAAQVIARAIRRFQIDLPLQALFSSPTVGEMAVTIVQYQAQQAQPETVERLLAELERLST